MNVLFLDYDGVVNIPIWAKDKNGVWDCDFGTPRDGKVNSEQAVRWVSHFCERFNYSIVVTSTWRMYDNFAECLYNGGLDESVKILGSTSVLHENRGREITKWLNEHPEVKNYLIFDDDTDMDEHIGRLVKCNSLSGFTGDSFNCARQLHEAFNKEREDEDNR